MWPLAGAVLVAFGLVPSAWHWLSAPVAGESVWQAAAAHVAIDATFVGGALFFLAIAINYGNTRGPLPPAPYPGAWVERDGRQLAPRGFTPGYLSFALAAALVAPALVLLLSRGPAAPLAFATLGPYLLVFVPQILLETRYLSRSFMTPVLPLLFAPYRLWQFVRSLELVERVGARRSGAAGAGLAWLRWYLLGLMAFWVFDTACTLLWLPWIFDWQLMDAGQLARIAQLRREQQQQQQGRRADGAQQQQRHRQQQQQQAPVLDVGGGAAAPADDVGAPVSPAATPPVRRREARGGAARRTPSSAGASGSPASPRRGGGRGSSRAATAAAAAAAAAAATASPVASPRASGRRRRGADASRAGLTSDEEGW